MLQVPVSGNPSPRGPSRDLPHFRHPREALRAISGEKFDR